MNIMPELREQLLCSHAEIFVQFEFHYEDAMGRTT